MHQSTTPSLSQTIWPRWASKQFFSLPIVKNLLPVTFGYSLSSEAVVMRQLRRWKRLWRRSLTRSHKRTFMGPFRSCWNCTTSPLQPGEITSKQTRVSCVYLSRKVLIRKKSGNIFNDPRTPHPAKSVLDITLNNLMARPLMLDLWECGAPFIAMALRSTLSEKCGTWLGPIYGLNRTNCILTLNWFVLIRTIWLNGIA